MENLTIYLVIFFAGIILGGMAVLGTASQRWPAAQADYAPAMYHAGYSPYHMRGSPGWTIFLVLLLALAVVLIVVAKSPAERGGGPQTEYPEEGRDLSPNLLDIDK
jgi:hypothetical protein